MCTVVSQPKSKPAMLTPPHATPAARALPKLSAIVEPARSFENMIEDCMRKECGTGTAVVSYQQEQ